MADHPPDPKTYRGIPLVYPAYRSTPVGEALGSVLEELDENQIISMQLQQKILDKFDETMTRYMDQVPPSTCQIEGTTINFQFIYNYFHIFMKPGIIKLQDKTITSECLEILALQDDK